MTVHRFVFASVLLLYLCVQFAGLTSIGLTDDDDFYVPAGTSYFDWLARAATLEKSAWTRAAIDQAFTPNWEHPPIAKYVFGICQKAFQKWLGPTDSARVGTVLFSTMCAWLLLLFGTRYLGKRGVWIGALAALFLLCLPRFYFHSHVATLDVPVSAMYLAAAWFALEAERSRRAVLWSGLVFGLALATKLNAPFLLVAYAVFVVLTRTPKNNANLALGAKSSSGARTSVALPSVPAAFVSMVLIGPIVFVLSWPRLWFDFVQRFGAYVNYHVNHYPIYFLYFGKIFVKDPFAPWHAPFVMVATTVPLGISALALVGGGFAVPVVWDRIRSKTGVDTARRREGDLLLWFALNAFVCVAVVAFSGGPKYGGEKLMMPFYPFWCLFAAYGAARLVAECRLLFKTPWPGVVATTLALGSSVGLGVRYGSYALSEYNALAGGLRGATALGFERQYYDIAFRDLVSWLDKEAPPNLRVHFLPNNWEYVRTYKWYKKAKELRQDVQVVERESAADWIVLTHERRFARYGDDLQRYRHREVIKEHRVDGVPIWTILRAK